MKKEEKKKSKKGTICKIALVTLTVAGATYLAYKKIPVVKNFIDKVLPFGETTTVREIKTKPFRKYETYHKKK